MIEQLQRTAEWMTARKGRITGSIAGAALGLCPWRTPDDVIRTLVREYHGAESEFKGNPATNYGNQHERAAMLWFMRKTGLDVEDVGFLKYEEWLGASPDGLVSDGSVLEIKCPFGFRNTPVPVMKSLEEQPHYYAQVQLEMLCAGRETAYFVQYRPAIGDVFDHEYQPEFGDIQTVSLNPEWLAEYLPKLRTFYERYLSEIDNKAHLEDLRVEIDTQETSQICDRIGELDAMIAQLTDERKDLIDKLVKLADGKDAIISGHKLTKVERKGNINYSKALKELAPTVSDDDLEPYRGKGSVSYRFT